MTTVTFQIVEASSTLPGAASCYLADEKHAVPRHHPGLLSGSANAGSDASSRSSRSQAPAWECQREAELACRKPESGPRSQRNLASYAPNDRS